MFSIINIENALSKALTTQSCVKFGEFEEAWLKFTNQYDFLGGSIQYGFEEEAEVVGRIDFKDFENIYLKLLSGKRNIIGEWAEQIRIDMDKAGRKLYGLPEQVSTEEPMAEFDFFDENDDHTKVVIYKKDGYVYYDRRVDQSWYEHDVHSCSGIYRSCTVSELIRRYAWCGRYCNSDVDFTNQYSCNSTSVGIWNFFLNQNSGTSDRSF